MFARALHNEHHRRRLTITLTGQFWEVVEEEDSLVVSRKVYDDWHRVERARRVFAQEAEALCQAGWVNG